MSPLAAGLLGFLAAGRFAAARSAGDLAAAAAIASNAPDDDEASRACNTALAAYEADSAGPSAALNSIQPAPGAPAATTQPAQR